MRFIKLIFKVVLILIILLSLTLSFFFFKSEKINPAIIDIEDNYFLQDLPDTLNIFYYIIAFGCSENIEPFIMGEKFVDYQKNKTNSYQEIIDLNLNNFLISEVDSIWFNLTENNSLKYLKNNHKLIRKLYENNRILDKRFNKLTQLSICATPYKQNYLSYTPMLLSFVNFYRLRLLSNLDLYFSSNSIEGISNIEKDLDFVRILLAESDLLIFKLTSQLLFEFTLQSMDFIINNEENLNEIENNIINIQPLNEIESSLKSAFINEYFYYSSKYDVSLGDFRRFKFNLLISVLTDKQSKTDINSNLYDLEIQTIQFFKTINNNLNTYFQLLTLSPNKLLNQLYFNIEPYINISELQSTKLNDEFIKLNSKKTDEQSEYLMEYFMPNNDLNKQWIIQNRDLDGKINLLKIKYLIKRENIDKRDIPMFIETHKYKLFNPYYDEQIYFNAADSTLNFKSLVKYNFSDIRSLKI